MFTTIDTKKGDQYVCFVEASDLTDILRTNYKKETALSLFNQCKKQILSVVEEMHKNEQLVTTGKNNFIPLNRFLH